MTLSPQVWICFDLAKAEVGFCYSDHVRCQSGCILISVEQPSVYGELPADNADSRQTKEGKQ